MELQSVEFSGQMLGVMWSQKFSECQDGVLQLESYSQTKGRPAATLLI